jgi:NAD(P)-dependent dehydrogenase (short-subunit alcohol dehydrogenase family)
MMTTTRKTWLITGISRGLGKSLAEAVMRNGDTVIGTVRSGKPDIQISNGELRVLTLDVAELEAIPAIVEAAFAVTGGLDVVVNNAGYGLLGALEHATEEQIAHLFAVDVFGPIRLIRAALPRLRAQGSGHIINITSIAGRAPMPGSSLYAAAKYALEGLSDSLAQEVAPMGIKVTAVAPGAFRTEFLSADSIRKIPGETAEYSAVAASLNRLDAMAGTQLGDPDRAAAAIMQLVNDPSPPVHLLLGSDALSRARASLDKLIAEIDGWEAVTNRTDYPI